MEIRYDSTTSEIMVKNTFARLWSLMYEYLFFTGCKSVGADIAFVVDGSGSVGANDFAESLNFVTKVCGQQLHCCCCGCGVLSDGTWEECPWKVFSRQTLKIRIWSWVGHFHAEKLEKRSENDDSLHFSWLQTLRRHLWPITLSLSDVSNFLEIGVS